MRVKVFMAAIVAGLVCLSANVSVHAEDQFVRELTDYEREHAGQAAEKWASEHEGAWYDVYGREILRIENNAVNGCPITCVYGIAGGGKQYAAIVRIAEEQGERDIKTETVGDKFLYFDMHTLRNTQEPVYFESICGVYLGMSAEAMRQLIGVPDSVQKWSQGNGEIWKYGKLGAKVAVRDCTVTELRLGPGGGWRLDRTGFTYASSPSQIYAAYQGMYPSLNKMPLAKFNERAGKKRFFTIRTGPGEYLQCFGKQEIIFGAFCHT